MSSHSHVGDLVGGRGQGHDPCSGRLLEQRHQRGGEREVPHVVHPELRLPTGAHAGFRAGHDAGVVDQEVERREVGEHGLCELPDGGEIGEVQRSASHAVDPGQCLGRLLGGAHGHDHLHALGGEGLGGLDADAAVAAGHDGGLAGQLEVGEHLGAGAAGVEAGLGGNLVGNGHGVTPGRGPSPLARDGCRGHAGGASRSQLFTSSVAPTTPRQMRPAPLCRIQARSPAATRWPAMASGSRSSVLRPAKNKSRSSVTR